MRSLVRLGVSGFLLASASGCSVFEAPIDTSMGENPIEPEQDAAADAAATVVDAATADARATTARDAGSDSAVAIADASDSDAAMGGGGGDGGSDAAVLPSCVLPNVDPMDVCSGAIVINEVDGSGNDFVEIYNRSDAPVNISGWVIADDSAGSPDVAEGAVVPPGTVLEAHRFLYVWANLSAEPGGNAGMLFQACIPGTPPPCLHSMWGVTAGGERLYLLNDSLTVVCAVNYPNAVLGGEAFGRIPDGASSLCPTAPSPGESNARSTLR